MTINHGPNPKTTRPSGFFITGTDTDVGKTYAAACIAYTLYKQEVQVSPRKPIASGCIRRKDGTLLAEDALFVKQACHSSEALETICPYTFAPPISPSRALLQAGMRISTQMLQKACKVEPGHLALVEGAGGFYSPLCSDGLNRDLAIALGYPVILVVANRLGCLNHFLLSLEAIQTNGLTLHSVIVNDLNENADPENLADIQSFCRQRNVPTLHLPYSASGCPILIHGLMSHRFATHET